jgi:hypothetical protein
MGVTAKKRAKLVALNEHTSMPLLLVWENRMCQELFVHTRIRDHFLETEKENVEERETSPRTDQLLLRNSRLNQTMISKDLQRAAP